MTKKYEVNVNVLGFEEDGQWCALALEMDLRGYGENFEEALNDLDESVKMQISFAQFKGNTDLIFHPAERKYFKLFARAQKQYIEALALGQPTVQSEYIAAGIPVPPAHVIANYRGKFRASNA